MIEELKKIETDFDNDLAVASGDADTEAVRVKYLGRKGLMKAIMPRLKDLSPDDKRVAGQFVNALKTKIEAALTEKLAAAKCTVRRGGGVDFSLPGNKRTHGHRHPVMQVMEELKGIFRTLGFSVATAPDVDDLWHNFDALNIPAGHPARMRGDNFYTAKDGWLLRTATSNCQIHYMEKNKPPIRIVCPGRVYRPDTVDATHFYMFHQIEGLAVGENVSMADMKATLELAFRSLFGSDVKTRLRPHFFPFTEPSAELDMSCVFCRRDGGACPVCKSTGWIEMLGCGMVDVNVLQMVGIDPERYTGFAFGMGVDRIALLRFGINDIRLLFENNLSFLEQF